MPEWSPEQYLKFQDERTQACRDLAARVAERLPRILVHRIVDLGCGPGNSTAILARAWPDADLILGIDNSPPMLAAARAAEPALQFQAGEIADWARNETRTFDLVFSNAALQWVPDHARLIPRLWEHVAEGGALAVQMPANENAAACALPREMAASAAWRESFPSGAVPNWRTQEREFYYPLLAPSARRIDLWDTEYVQVMPNTGAIVEWYKGSGLRPFLEALPEPAARERFLAEYAARLPEAYPAQADGRVLFPFRRRFLVAYR